MEHETAHTNRDIVSHPAQVGASPAITTASPNLYRACSGSSSISTGTQTDMDISLDFDSIRGTRSSTSTPPTSPPATLRQRTSYGFHTQEMPADHPPVDVNKLPSWSHMSPEHAYQRKPFSCPCPAIATLVNHNYLTPKTKCERVPWYKMVSALRECFHLDLWNALFLTLMATIMCGNWWAVSLKDLQRHNKVEHDASITRHDFNTGKNFRSVDPDRLKVFLDMSEDGKKMTLENYALRRCQVESQLWLDGSSFYRWFKHSWIAFLGRGEVALTMRVFGGDQDEDEHHGMKVRKDWLKEWFEHERLPADWKRPEKPFNIIDTFRVGFALNRRMNAIRAEDEQLNWCACPRSSCI